MTGLIQNFMSNAYAQNTIPELVVYICGNGFCGGVGAGASTAIQGYISGTTLTVASVTSGVVATGEYLFNHISTGDDELPTDIDELIV
jgi:hypothetical protein